MGHKAWTAPGSAMSVAHFMAVHLQAAELLQSTAVDELTNWRFHSQSCATSMAKNTQLLLQRDKWPPGCRLNCGHWGSWYVIWWQVEVMSLLKCRLSYYPAGTTGTSQREWLCLFLSLFVFVLQLLTVSGNQGLDGPPLPLLLFSTAPNPFLCIESIPRRRSFASKRYLIHCFLGLTHGSNKQWRAGWRLRKQKEEG